MSGVVQLSRLGGVIGFIVLLVFFWFIVSKTFDFFAFALGGGVGRYSTTKLYRRFQWLTFALFMSVPVFVIGVLIVEVTPLGRDADGYLARVDRIKESRLAEAEADRDARFNAAESTWNAGLAEAQRQRIEEAYNAMEEEYLSTMERNYELFEEEEGALLERRDAVVDGHRIYNENNAAYVDELFRFSIVLQRQFNIFLRDTQLALLDSLPSRNFDVFIKNYVENDCRGLLANQNYDEMEKLGIREFCLTFVVWLNMEANALVNVRAEPLKFPVMQGLTGALREIEVIWSRIIAIHEEERPRLDQHYQDNFPPIRNRTAEIDEERFPLIDVADFPVPQIEDFPLRVDQSPIDVPNPYEERLTATFLEHWWWVAGLSFIVWLIIQNALQLQISRVHGRITRFLDEGRFGFGGLALFASMFEEWGKPYAPRTLYMGRSLYNLFDEVGLDGEAHMITVAGSRGGKGTTAIIPNLLLWEGSCVVVDPKGTNAHVTAEARRKMGQKVHLIDPFGIVTQESDRFDPFANLRNDDVLVRERITSIADALVIPDENTREKHWDDGARTIIAGLISHVVSGCSGMEKCLYSIRDMIKRLPEEQDRMWAAMSLNEDGGGYAQDAAMRYIRGSETNKILGIMSNADKHTEWLSSEVMRRVTPNPTFSLSDLKNEPTTVYLIIPPRQLTKQNRLIRLFINLMLDAMEDGGRSDVPVLMMIDEFLALDRMPEIPTAFATMASYNLVIWLFVQDLMGLQKKYKDEFNALIANSRAMQVFATTDDVTKEYVSKRLGNRPLGSLGGIAKSNDNVPIRASDDIEKGLKAGEGRQYVIEAGSSAMLIEKVPY